MPNNSLLSSSVIEAPFVQAPHVLLSRRYGILLAPFILSLFGTGRNTVEYYCCLYVKFFQSLYLCIDGSPNYVMWIDRGGGPHIGNFMNDINNAFTLQLCEVNQLCIFKIPQSFPPKIFNAHLQQELQLNNDVGKCAYYTGNKFVLLGFIGIENLTCDVWVGRLIDVICRQNKMGVDHLVFSNTKSYVQNPRNSLRTHRA
jgi:hypothetical protein